jgi:hypothetical protein
MSKNERANSLFKMLTRQSKKSKSPPLIELRKILNGEIKLTEDNLMFRLSIKDYNLMCKNKILKNIMAKTLNTDIESLTSYCNDVKILENYVDLSKSTINEKKIAKRLPIKILLTDLPEDSIKLITKHYQYLLEYKLRDWVKLSKILKCDELSSNLNAIDLLSLPKNNKYINYTNLSKNRNPKALLLIEKKIIEEKNLSETKYKNLKNKISWYDLSENPIAVDLLYAYQDDISWDAICNNTNPKALELLENKIKEDPDEINWEELSANPAAIKILKKYPDNIDYSGLSANSSDEAIQLLKDNPDDIDLNMLSFNKNPKAFELLQELLKIKPEKLYDWTYLSENSLPEAIKILKANFKNIDWGRLSSNSSDEAIQLLEDELKNNPINNKINWDILSANTNLKALELLKNNQKKIFWPYLSANPSIFIIE